MNFQVLYKVPKFLVSWDSVSFCSMGLKVEGLTKLFHAMNASDKSVAECRSPVNITVAPYLRGPGFKSWPGDRVSQMGFPSVPPRKFRSIPYITHGDEPFLRSSQFPAFYGTRRFITVFTRALHWSLSWARSIQSIPSHPISLRSILILSTHLRLGLPSGLLPSGFPVNILYASLFSPIGATCPAHLSLHIYYNLLSSNNRITLRYMVWVTGSIIK
jgi:hypothetical protein